MKHKISIALFLVILTLTSVFSGCSDEITGEAKIKYDVKDGEAAVREVPDKTNMTEIIIPDEYEGVPVTEIKDFAAVNLENIEKITIGKNVKTIGLWSFENNRKLKAFEVSAENGNFCSVDGVLFTKDKKTLLFYPAAKDLVKSEDGSKDISSYAIPEGTETISTKAFYKCQNISSITFPESVLKIEEKAFFRCSALQNIVLPGSLSYIGKDAFSYCSEFTEITIPSSIKEIGTYAFYNCSKLKKIEIYASLSDITLGDKWYPTDNGKKIGDLEIKEIGQ